MKQGKTDASMVSENNVQEIRMCSLLFPTYAYVCSIVRHVYDHWFLWMCGCWWHECESQESITVCAGNWSHVEDFSNCTFCVLFPENVSAY